MTDIEERTAWRAGLEARTVDVDLSPYFDNTGVTRTEATAAGGFNIWSNTFPAGELPPPGGRVTVEGVPFRFLDRNDLGADNLRCGRQLIRVPAGDYDWIYLLAAAERRSEDAVHLHFADSAVDAEWLRVSDFWPQTPAYFGERAGLRCTVLHYPRHVQGDMGPAIWRSRVPVTRERALEAIRLPDNPAIHIFALTLVGADPRHGGEREADRCA